ncbi:hypothetical protein ACFQU2_41905 [Siccirubricoccus deserti]
MRQQPAHAVQRLRHPPEQWRVGPVDPLALRQRQQLQAGPQQRGDVCGRQAARVRLGNAAAEHVAAELQPLLQPVRQANQDSRVSSRAGFPVKDIFSDDFGLSSQIDRHRITTL